MGIAAAAGVGVPAQRVLHLRFVQRVVQLGNRRCRITKCRMSGDVFHSLAIDIDLAPILQAFQVGTMAGTFQVGYGFVIEVAFSDF